MMMVQSASTLENLFLRNINPAVFRAFFFDEGLSSGGRWEKLPRLAQLVEHLTVVVKKHVSADIRVSPVQVRERGPIALSAYNQVRSIQN